MFPRSSVLVIACAAACGVERTVLDLDAGQGTGENSPVPEIPLVSGLASVFANDPATLARLEFNGDVEDSSGNGRTPRLIGGSFERTQWGMGLRLAGSDPQGLDWSAYADRLAHPYTIEMVITPDRVDCWAKLLGISDASDFGWYYCNGFQAYPSASVKDAGIVAGTRQYFALVSTSATTMDVYFQGVKIGSTATSFVAPPSSAIFFRDDSATSRREQLSGVVEAMRISSVSRTPAEIAAVQHRVADSVFSNDSSTLARLELNGNVEDSSGNGRTPRLLGGTFEPTSRGMGLRLAGSDPQGIDWSAYAGLLAHPYTIEMVITPDRADCWAKLLGTSDASDLGWYYCNGFQAYPNAPIKDAGIVVSTRQYFALVSTSATTMDVYFQGAKIGSTATSFTAPPSSAIFFRDDSVTSRHEQLSGVVEAMRISSASRTPAEIAEVQRRLADSVFRNDSSTLARLEFNGDVQDSSGNERNPKLLGGTLERTSFGMGLRLAGSDPQGLDWSAYAGLLTHPYTIEMVITPDRVDCWAKLLGTSDASDLGWYYCNGFQAYPNSSVTDAGIIPGTRQYFALVSTSATTADVYFQGAKIGSTATSFTAPPGSAIFFRDDSVTYRTEQLSGIVEALRISSGSRTPAEIAEVQVLLTTRP